MHACARRALMNEVQSFVFRSFRSQSFRFLLTFRSSRSLVITSLHIFVGAPLDKLPPASNFQPLLS